MLLFTEIRALGGESDLKEHMVNNELYTNERTVVRVRASRKKQLAFLSTSMYKVIENKERRIVDEAKMYYNSNKTNMH